MVLFAVEKPDEGVVALEETAKVPDPASREAVSVPSNPVICLALSCELEVVTSYAFGKIKLFGVAS